MVIVGLMALAGCDDAGSSSATSGASAPVATECGSQGTMQSADELPDLTLIPKAIDALQAKFDVPVEYFEINATARLVNLFVALDQGTVVQPWVYVDGELTSQEGQPAQGGTFTADDIDFDPALVLSKVRDAVPDAILESFYLHGDGQGHMLYGVLTSNLCGGGLDVVLGPDGTVKSVDPVS